VYPRLRHRSDTTGTEPAVLEQPKRRELELDDAVVPPVTQRRDGQLELIADERVRAQLAQDVTAHEQVGDAEGAPLRIAHGAGRHPVQPVGVAAGVVEAAVVALRDRSATDHATSTISRRPRKSGSSRIATPSAGAGAPPRFAQYTSMPTRAAPPTSCAEPATKSTSTGSSSSRSRAIR